MSDRHTNEPPRDAGTPAITLRDVAWEDVPALYLMQLDAEANRMAGTKARDRAEFERVWLRNRADPTITARVIVRDGRVIGGISRFVADGHEHVGYWIERSAWGKGVATSALRTFLAEIKTRPIYATVSVTNFGSIRVLERCGFVRTGTRAEPETERYIAGEVAFYRLD